MPIQSIIFDKRKYSNSSALLFLKKHNYKPIKYVHSTDNFLRYRLLPVKRTASYRIINFNKYIKAIYEIPF